MPWSLLKLRFENKKTIYTYIALTANKITEIFYLLTNDALNLTNPSKNIV